MRLEQARKIDYWAGIPLCFLVNVWRVAERMFPCPPPARPRKILFLELSEMGAAILASSAMRKAQELYPGSEVHFLIFQENAESVRILGIIPDDRIMTIRNRGIFTLILDTIRAIRAMRARKIDTVVDMELFSRFTSIITYLSGARNRVGFHRFTMEGSYRADAYTHTVLYNAYMHISRNFLALVYALQKNGKEGPRMDVAVSAEETVVPRVTPDSAALADIRNKLKSANAAVSEKSKIVVVNLGKGEYLPLRKWPAENYAALIERLLADTDVFVVSVGTRSEIAREEPRNGAASSRVIDLAGKTSVRELIALFSVARLLISHDSGCVNLASLTPVNIIVMFGPETPLLYAPLDGNTAVFYKHFACSPCFSAYNHRLSACGDNACLKAITVEEVYQAARRYLAG